MNQKRLLPILRFALMGLALAFVPSLVAQTTNMGGPKAWQEKLPAPKNAKVVLPDINVTALEAEDEINNANKTAPWRFGFEHIVNDDFNETGRWDDTKGGRIWQITYSAPQALTMNVFFNKFRLAEGASVHIYASDGSVYDGAYTSSNNQPDKLLSSIPIATNSITVEFFEPSNVQGQSDLVIGHVVQGYREIAAFINASMDQSKALNGSGPCNYDTKCAELFGNPFGAPGLWDGPVRSVAMMLQNGSALCSAALVNNTANDGTPYVLSANHCGTTNGGGRAFLFGWESPTAVCGTAGNSTNGPTTNQINGATLRANRSGSDFALWEMNSTPPLSYNVYYAGWDRSGNIPTQATGIHHPSGDVKKICRESDAPYMSATSGAQVWWVDDWEYGVTEPGSSGSPLFDQNQRIIGQLYGGRAACSGTVNNGKYDYYGRFNVSWNTGGTASSRLKEWLDPSGLDPSFIDGYDPNAPTAALDAGIMSVNGLEGNYCDQTVFTPSAVLRNYGASTLTSVDLSATLNGLSAGGFTWTGSLASGVSIEVTMPTFSVSSSGAYHYEVTAANPNGGTDEDSSNDVASADFNVSLDGTQATLSLTFDCWAGETSWDIKDNAGSILYSGGEYPGAFDEQTITETFCLAEGCYTFTIYDSYGDGMFGSNYAFCDVDGDYAITDGLGNALVEMTAPNANFGSQASHAFCIGTQSPCQTPYPVVTNLTTEVQPTGIVLQWDPIPGSIGCRVEGGIAPSGGLQTFTTLGAEVESYFVNQSKLKSGKTYRWRVQCGCSNSMIGDWSVWNEFTWSGGSGLIGGNDKSLSQDVWLYPNPASTELQVTLYREIAGVTHIAVFDARGSMVYVASEKTNAGDASFTVDLSQLSSGIYVLEVTGDDMAIRKRFVKE